MRTFRFAKINSLVTQEVKGKAKALHSSVFSKNLIFQSSFLRKDLIKGKKIIF